MTLLLGDSTDTCKRCSQDVAIALIRNERLCRGCVMKYVQTKVVKRLEAFKLQVRNAAGVSPRKLMLALSYGTASTVMLYVVNNWLENQRRRVGRPAFNLYIVYARDGTDDPPADHLDLVKNEYPNIDFHTIDVSVSRSSDSGDTGAEGLSQWPWLNSLSNTNTSNVQNPFSSVLSSSSHADLLQIATLRSLVEAAQKLECDGILWGDSTTRLAEKVLGETAKGRGFSLPWVGQDGPSTYGISFYYPMKDLMQKEISCYARLKPLDAYIPDKDQKRTAANMKNNTIEGLMKEYFEGVEEQYPNIVANVVKTSGRLDSLQNAVYGHCALCGMPMAQGVGGLYDWAGYQQQDSTQNSGHERDLYASEQLCYGCTRATLSSSNP